MADLELIEQKLASLRLRYFAELPDKLTEIKNIWHDMKSTSEFNNTALERALHKIAGSAGMYGANELTLSARKLENYLAEHHNTIKQTEIEIIESYLNDFENIISQLTS